MRSPLYKPSISDFDLIFAPEPGGATRGGSFNDIQIYSKKRGGSFFGILGRVIKQTIPFIRKIVLPEIGGFVKNVADDVSNNLPIKSSMKRNLISSVGKVGKRIVRGGAKKRKNKIKKNRSKKRTKPSKSGRKTKKRGKKTNKRCNLNMTKDIFDNDIYSHI